MKSAPPCLPLWGRWYRAARSPIPEGVSSYGYPPYRPSATSPEGEASCFFHCCGRTNRAPGPFADAQKVESAGP